MWDSNSAKLFEKMDPMGFDSIFMENNASPVPFAWIHMSLIRFNLMDYILDSSGSIRFPWRSDPPLPFMLKVNFRTLFVSGILVDFEVK